MKNALVWCGARLRMGVDFGEDKPPITEAHAVVTQYGLDKLREEHGAHFISNVPGLNVYAEHDTLPTRFVTGTLQGKALKEVSRFQEALRQALALDLHPTDEETLAFDLYSQSHYETPIRARLVTLVSAIECLGERKERRSEEQKLLQEVMESTQRSGLTKSEKDSILGALRGLRQESICRFLLLTISCRSTSLIDVQRGQGDR